MKYAWTLMVTTFLATTSVHSGEIKRACDFSQKLMMALSIDSKSCSEIETGSRLNELNAAIETGSSESFQNSEELRSALEELRGYQLYNLSLYDNREFAQQDPFPVISVDLNLEKFSISDLSSRNIPDSFFDGTPDALHTVYFTLNHYERASDKVANVVARLLSASPIESVKIKSYQKDSCPERFFTSPNHIGSISLYWGHSTGCDFNFITHFNSLRSFTLEMNNEKVKNFDLSAIFEHSKNTIRSIDIKEIQSETRWSGVLPDLESVFLENLTDKTLNDDFFSAHPHLKSLTAVRDTKNVEIEIDQDQSQIKQLGVLHPESVKIGSNALLTSATNLQFPFARKIQLPAKTSGMFRKLSILNLEGTPLTRLPSDLFSSLGSGRKYVYVNLFGTQMSSMDRGLFDALNGYVYLSLPKTLKSIDTNNLSKIILCTFNSNTIVRSCDFGTYDLHALNITDTDCKSKLPFFYRSYNLSLNQFTKFPGACFDYEQNESAGSSRYLDLSANQIDTIYASDFSKTNLQGLNIRGNPLRSIDFGFLKANPGLEYLEFDYREKSIQSSIPNLNHEAKIYVHVQSGEKIDAHIFENQSQKVLLFLDGVAHISKKLRKRLKAKNVYPFLSNLSEAKSP